ncbi:MAG: SDR family NAD(P)-dependent oxidoreductase, partial [Myxococcota bacterium]|nr:SDR family NAD(P)-dependent oxidoreductase [Myxococcota bacterium]
MPRLPRPSLDALVPRGWRILAERRYRAALATALRGRRIVVTGASSGIGRAFALQVGAAGAEAVLVARRRDELERVAQEVERLGGKAHVRVADLSDAAEAAELAATILREHGPVDILVNNAGRSVRRSLLDTKAQDFERLIATNFLGPLALTCGLVPAMLERGSGHVIQISTIGVQTGAPNFAAYVSAKAAADHFA